MTYQSKYRENECLLAGYVGFLEECASYDQKLKLSAEIGRLAAQNKQIETMEFAYTKTDISDYIINVNAVL